MCKEAREKIAELIEAKYSRLIMKIAYDITKDYDSAEDIKQTVLSKCCRQYKTMERLCEEQFHTYVVRAAKNTALKAVAKRKNEQATLEKFVEKNRLDFTFDYVDFKAFEENDEFSPEMVRLLKSMDPIDREIILLKFYFGMSNPETAEYLNMSVEAVKKRYYRLRVQMKGRSLESEGDE